MKEPRNCVMCSELFRVKPTSKRKTCCTECSRKYYQTPEYKAKIKEYSQRRYKKNKDNEKDGCRFV